jgi:hypothetical protein
MVHQRVYGGWTVYSAGDHFVDGEFQVVGPDPDYTGRTRRLIGLLVDRQFGLIAWAPAYLALVPAVAVVIQRRVRGALPLLALLATGWATATWVALTMHGWWWPGRQVVVVLPLAVIVVAMLATRSRAWLWFVAVGGVVGFLSWVWLAFEASTGRLTLIVDFADTANPWYRTWSAVLPDHMNWAAPAILLTALWAGVLAVLTVLTLRSLPPESNSVDDVGAAALIDATSPA